MLLSSCSDKVESLTVETLRSKYNVPNENHLILVDLDRCDPCNIASKEKAMKFAVSNPSTLIVITKSRKKASIWLKDHSMDFYTEKHSTVKNILNKELVQIFDPNPSQ